MTAPLDLLTGTQDAIIRLIQDQLPPERRGMVRQSLKQDFEPPFHLVGDISTDNAGRPGEQIEELEADVHTIYRGGDRRELLKLLHEIRLATDAARVEVDGAIYQVRWHGAIASSAAADGKTYAGLTTLNIIAEPA